MEHCVIRSFANPAALTNAPAPPEVIAALGIEAMRAAMDNIGSWPGYAPTPLVDLAGLAASVGVGGICYKDESARFGLKSFKALGGAYAVYRVVSRFIREHESPSASVSIAAVLSGKYRSLTRQLTVACATDGNHGLSVAWGARLFGCSSVIFLPGDVSHGRQERIESYGAVTKRIAGTYDEAVRAAADTATRNGWIVVSDTSYRGYMDIPRDVMSGYSVMTAEIFDKSQLLPAITHVIVQGGVGGLAAAVLAHIWHIAGAARPIFIVVEPEAAACLLESARAGKPVTIEGDLKTIMGGLSCGSPSLVAWEVLSRGVDFFATVPEAAVPPAMRAMAAGIDGDPPLVSGESGVAGVAFLQQLAADPALKQELRLDARSKILLFGTEGDTDPDLYRRIVESAPSSAHAAA